MNARNDFADAGLDAGLFPEFSDVFAGLADDNPSILGANKCSEGQSILPIRAGGTRLRGRAWKETWSEGSLGYNEVHI